MTPSVPDVLINASLATLLVSCTLFVVAAVISLIVLMVRSLFDK